MIDSSTLEELPSSSKWVSDNFLLGELLGSGNSLPMPVIHYNLGTFGRVYTVECRKNRKLYALKEISQTSLPKYIAQELKIMATLGGKCNIMNMLASYREKGRVFLVMDRFPHDNFKNILPIMTSEEKLSYYKNLLIALEYLHRNNIIHRDVKPANFLYNRANRRYALIDFGLSHEGSQAKETVEIQQRRRTILKNNNNGPPAKIMRLSCGCNDKWLCSECQKKPLKQVNKAGTPGFRPPEILLRFDQPTQTIAIDVWAAGVVLLSLLFRRHPIFRPVDDYDAICQICSIIGTRPMVDAAMKNGVRANLPNYPGVDYAKLMKVVREGWSGMPKSANECPTCMKHFFGNTKGRCFCVEAKEAEIPDDDIDRMLIMLLKKSLNPDPTSRFSATTLLLYISDFERYRLSEEPLVDKNHE